MRSPYATYMLTLMLVVVWALGGCDRPNEPARVSQPFEGLVPITLGAETRLATGLGAEHSVRRAGPLAALPRTLEVPAAFAEATSVVVDYRVWERTGPARERARNPGRYSEIVPVASDGPSRRITLDGWSNFASDVPVNAIVTVLPRLLPARHSFEWTVTVPAGAFLRFGYGLRDAIWNDRGAQVRFEVRARDAHGEARLLFARTLDPRDAADRRWHDERIDLGAVARRETTLVFTAAATDGDGQIFLPTWSDPVVQVPGRVTRVPNFVIVSLDTLRAGNLGCYGYARATSPFIDSIARAGTLFERALTTSVTTAPSHMSLFTGRYPPRHGILHLLERKHREVATLASLLRAGGYHTAAFTENGSIIRDRGFGEGMSEYTEIVDGGATGSGDAKRTFAEASRWLEDNRQLPFFLFVHTYQVHSPYDPPAAYASLFDDDGFTDRVPAGFRGLRDNYDREIRIVDDAARKLFDVLATAGLTDSTIVVLLADHGEEFAEHGAFQHGTAVFDETLRVPLIFWGPGRIPVGQRRSVPVSLIDVAPTILDLAGLPIPAGLDGVSLRQEIVAGGTLAPRTLFGEGRGTRRWTTAFTFERFNPPQVAVLVDDTKYIVHRPREGEALPAVAYRPAEDRYEERPLRIPARTLPAVTRLVDEYLSGSTTAGTEALPAAAPPADLPDPEVLEKLRVLGYVD